MFFVCLVFFQHWLCGAAEGIITWVDAYLPRCQSIKLPSADLFNCCKRYLYFTFKLCAIWISELAFLYQIIITELLFYKWFRSLHIIIYLLSAHVPYSAFVRDCFSLRDLFSINHGLLFLWIQRTHVITFVNDLSKIVLI